MQGYIMPIVNGLFQTKVLSSFLKNYIMVKQLFGQLNSHDSTSTSIFQSILHRTVRLDFLKNISDSHFPRSPLRGRQSTKLSSWLTRSCFLSKSIFITSPLAINSPAPLSSSRFLTVKLLPNLRSSNVPFFKIWNTLSLTLHCWFLFYS